MDVNDLKVTGSHSDITVRVTYKDPDTDATVSTQVGVKILRCRPGDESFREERGFSDTFFLRNTEYRGKTPGILRTARKFRPLRPGRGAFTASCDLPLPAGLAAAHDASGHAVQVVPRPHLRGAAGHHGQVE